MKINSYLEYLSGERCHQIQYAMVTEYYKRAATRCLSLRTQAICTKYLNQLSLQVHEENPRKKPPMKKNQPCTLILIPSKFLFCGRNAFLLFSFVLLSFLFHFTVSRVILLCLRLINESNGQLMWISCPKNTWAKLSVAIRSGI